MATASDPPLNRLLRAMGLDIWLHAFAKEELTLKDLASWSLPDLRAIFGDIAQSMYAQKAGSNKLEDPRTHA